jgi:hypothetical protein
VVILCEKAGLVDGNKVFLDATLLKANASLDSLTERRPYQELQTPQQYFDQVWTENKAHEEEEGSHTDFSQAGRDLPRHSLSRVP